MGKRTTKSEFSLIVSDPRRVNGQPCIKGTRLTVRRVVQIVAAFPNQAEMRAEYPELTPNAVRQALRFAAAYLGDEVASCC